MAQVKWLHATSGSWQAGSFWNTGSPPGTTDDALLTVAGTFTVTSSGFVQVNSVQLGAKATLVIAGGNTTELASGTGSGANAGTIDIQNSSVLQVTGTVDNTGSILEGATGGTTEFRLSGSTVLTGGGKFTMSDNATNFVFGSSTTTLTNVNNTISGAGALGDGSMALINQAKGVIDATGTNQLALNTGGNVIVNSGLLEGTGTGGLLIQSTVDSTSGGQIVAAGAGSSVQIVGGNVLRGGTISTSKGGVVEVINGNQGGLDGTVGAVTNTGSVVDGNGSALYLAGSIVNKGTINENSTGSSTFLYVTYPITTLSGGGSVLLTSDSNNFIQGDANGYGSGAQLINVDNTIAGAGQINNVTLVNQAKGTIDANQATSLTIDTANFLVNAGLMEATASGGLQINATVIDNAGGTVKAAGGIVGLGGSYIEGGTVSGVGSSVVETTSGTSRLDGLTQGALKITGTVKVLDGTFLGLLGVINNTGTINVAGASDAQLQLLSQTITLKGGGKVVLSDSGNNFVYSNFGQWCTLNNVNNTISGAGQFGDGQMQYTNFGTIQATGTNPLTVNLGSGSGVNETGGLMIASGAGGMNFTSGIFTNNGTIEATANSKVTLTGSAFDINAINGTLTGGTWEAAGNGATVLLAGDGPGAASIATDAANIILSGTGSVFLTGSGSTALESTLTTIAAGGRLSVTGGRGYVSVNALTDSGTLAVAGGTLQAPSFSVAVGSVLSGNGIVKGGITDSGTVTSAGGTLELVNGMSGSGAATISAKSTLQADGRLGVKTVTFATGGAAEVLALKTPSAVSSSIVGFAKGDTIDLLNIGATKLSYAGSTTSGTLTISAGTSTVAKLAFTGKYTTASFKLGNDGHNGTTIIGTGLAAADLTSVLGLRVAAGQADTSHAGGSSASLNTSHDIALNHAIYVPYHTV